MASKMSATIISCLLLLLLLFSFIFLLDSSPRQGHKDNGHKIIEGQDGVCRSGASSV